MDAIAITNHNMFCKEQYEEICKSLSITVFPGIEVDIEKGHLLVIASPSDLSDFSDRCRKISAIITSATDYLSTAQFIEIFPSPDRYLLIPHYEKSPVLQFERVRDLISSMICGEVNSIKKFVNCKKSSDSLVPVYFSDLRIKKNIDTFPSRCTYVDVDTLSLSAIKLALTDKAKVSLSSEDGHRLTDILSNGLKISTGLTVLLGERSSGKTHTLNAIAENTANPKFIEQFSLLTKDAELDERRFEDALRNRCSSVSEEYLHELKNIVDDVKKIYIERDDSSLDEYVKLLNRAADEADKEDVFSKTKLFSEPLFSINDLGALEKLVGAVNLLIDNKEYNAIINSFIEHRALLKLGLALMQKYIMEKELILKKNFLNDTIDTIKAELRVRTATVLIPDIDFYNLLMNKRKIARFNIIANAAKTEQTIFSKELHSFKIIATAKPFNGAQEIKSLSGKVIAFSDAFDKYNIPYEYLCALRKKEGVAVSDYYRFFVSIKYEVLNKHGFKASGGERSEYNLLEQLEGATQYDILLLDEPESSFDNLFLKSDVNSLIKDISQLIPVVVATHNNTIGASVKPDYILYTRKDVEQSGAVAYKIFSGFPTSAELTEVNGETISKHDILLDCLEAGEPTYIERRTTYEMSDH